MKVVISRAVRLREYPLRELPLYTITMTSYGYTNKRNNSSQCSPHLCRILTRFLVHEKYHCEFEIQNSVTCIMHNSRLRLRVTQHLAVTELWSHSLKLFRESRQADCMPALRVVTARVRYLFSGSFMYLNCRSS